MSLIRACSPEDMPAVAGLFQKTFPGRRRSAPESLEAYLAGLFLHHPWYDPELASRIYVSPEGAVRGFLGVLPLRMCFRGKKIRAAIAGSLMVDRPEENPLAGARLLRSFANGPQELSISESANRVSENLWQKLGGRTLPFESLEWLRILRPAGVALAFAREWFAPAVLLQPLASMIDRVARHTGRNPFGLPGGRGGYEYDTDAGEELLLEQIPRFAESYSVRPDWNRSSLQWVLAHARAKARRGPVCRMVYGKNHAPIGCYVYYGGPHGTRSPGRASNAFESMTTSGEATVRLRVICSPVPSGSCGESGFDLIVVARCHSVVSARCAAAASAPTKLGMRFAGAGKRATPFTLIARHTSSRRAALAARSSAGPAAS